MNVKHNLFHVLRVSSQYYVLVKFNISVRSNKNPLYSSYTFLYNCPTEFAIEGHLIWSNNKYMVKMVYYCIISTCSRVYCAYS